MSAADRRGLPPPGVRLCTLEAIPDGSCLERPLDGAPGAPGVLVFRRGSWVRAYRNVCPHFSLPLNSRPGEFLLVGSDRIMCAFHCAVFRWEDGLCVAGPAEGSRLDAVPVEVVDGQVLVRTG